jgi:hypothetical protein
MDSLQPPQTDSLPGIPDSLSNGTDSIDALTLKLKSVPEKLQFQVLQELSELGEGGLSAIMGFLQERRLSGSSPDLVAGKAYQLLFSSNSTTVADFLQTHFPAGVVPIDSDLGVDYTSLQRCLVKQDFQAADQLTLQKLCELVGSAAVQRKWLYFTEIDQLPVQDLHILNSLWLVHSEGRFGFSVQRDLWLGVGKNWDKLWDKIGWKDGNTWTRYPQEFTWNLTAPKGHLPLSNQLRGVRVFAALLAHPAWTSTDK